MKTLKHYILSIGLLLSALSAQAQEFFNLTAQEVRIDSVLPRFSYTRFLGANYADSVYQVSIEYPEFIDMSATDVARLRAITTEQLPEMPVVDQYVGVARRQGTLYVSLCPLVYREGKYQKLVSFMLKVAAKPSACARRAAAGEGSTYADHSVLATGRWAKIRISETGIYQLTADLVRRAGFSNINKVKIYGYGGAWQPEVLTQDYLAATDDLKEVPTCTIGGRRLFHGVGPVGWESATATERLRNPYSDYGYYFLTESDAEPLQQDSATFVSSFYPTTNDYHALVEDDGYAWFRGGRNFYDSKPLQIGSDRSMTMPAYSESGQLTVVLSYDGTFDVDVVVNGELAGTFTPTSTEMKQINDYSSAAVAKRIYTVNNLQASNTIVLLQRSGANVRPDYVALTSSQPKAAARLSTDNFPVPEYVYGITNQDHHADTAVDMVILIPTSQQVRSQAERLKTMHEEKDGLRVRIVPADELFNEFSSGTPDANAYRRYLKMLYDRAETEADMPRYLLLFGDAAWDNRMTSAQWKNYSPDDFLLCYESDDSFSEIFCYVTDDYFCLLDDGEGGNIVVSDKSDVAVGRLTARTEAEATVLVDKIIDYRNNEHAGVWQNTLCFMADYGNHNRHMNDAEQVIKTVQENASSFQIKKIYWDAYTRVTSSTGNRYPDVERLIKQQMRDGALVMNYIGHGSPYTMSHEQVAYVSDFAKSTSLRLPLWVTASCDIMPFDGQEENFGETAMFNKNGGAIAFFGTTRTVYSNYNQYMDRTFMKHVLSSTNGEINSIGEAARLAKNDLVTPSSPYRDYTENKLQYTLLGDPALKLAVPTGKVVIDRINGQSVADETAVLKAGSQVVVEGHVENGENFNGVASVTVRDVEEYIVCKLNNVEAGSDTIFKFRDRPNTIFAGSDSVRNGKFAFTFALPMDISYSDATGLMQVYAVNSDKTILAHGENERFKMGGDDSFQNDGIGPNIYCYLNSSSFTNGGKVNTTPYFFAEVSDKDGINVSGNGIGHDMELIIDGKMTMTYNLNAFFQYDFGDYRSGTVGYSLPELSEGQHKLLFRAWDVLNNSSTAELTFEVVKGLDTRIVNVMCTHNPASTNTTFVINHERVGSLMDIDLEVFDTSGRTLWHHTESGISTDNTYTVSWDLTVDGGRRLQTGVYLYRVSVSCEGSRKSSMAKKLIVLNK